MVDLDAPRLTGWAAEDAARIAEGCRGGSRYRWEGEREVKVKVKVDAALRAGDFVSACGGGEVDRLRREERWTACCGEEVDACCGEEVDGPRPR